tara:strand:+ start:41 stop:316 length:276 start_codon:yes stop_codon:yes gene_type:complete
MANSKDSNEDQKKTLDFHVGDLVYLKSDLSLRSGIGLILSTEFRSFDIHDLRDHKLEKSFSVLLPKVYVWWIRGDQKLWMDEQDLCLLESC